MAESPFPIPCDPLIAAFVDALDADEFEHFQERAAIAEYDGNLPRAEAEAMAYASTLDYRRRKHNPDAADGPPD